MGKHEKFFGRFVSVSLLVMATLNLYPWWTPSSVLWTTVHHTYDFKPLTKQEALAQIREAIDATIGNLPKISVEQASKNFLLVIMFDTLRSTKGPYAELAKDSQIMARVRHLAQLNTDSLDKNGKSAGTDSELSNFMGTDPRILALTTPTESSMNWKVLGAHISRVYWYSMLLAFLGFIGLMRLRSVSVISECMYPLRFAVALALFPISWIWYPYEDSDERVTRIVHFAGLCASFILSTTGGAFAQTVKKFTPDEKKDDPEHVLVLDTADQPAAGDPPKVKISFATAVVSKYMASIGGIPYDKPAVQSDLNFAFSNGWFFDFWSSSGFDLSANYGKELDYTVGYVGKNWVARVNFIDLSPQFSVSSGEMIDSYVKAQRSLRHGLSAYGQVDRFDVTTSYRKNSAFAFAFGLRHNWSRNRWLFGEDVSLLYDTGTFGFQSSWVERVKASISLAISPHWSWTPAQVFMAAPDRNTERGLNLAFSSVVSVH